jgi:hypothetical protein
MARISAATAAAMKVKEAEDQVAALTKKLETAENFKKWAESSRDEANKELEGVHAILDVMQGTLPRDKPDGYSKHPAGVRLASYLASK